MLHPELPAPRCSGDGRFARPTARAVVMIGASRPGRIRDERDAQLDDHWDASGHRATEGRPGAERRRHRRGLPADRRSGDRQGLRPRGAGSVFAPRVCLAAGALRARRRGGGVRAARAHHPGGCVQHVRGCGAVRQHPPGRARLEVAGSAGRSDRLPGAVRVPGDHSSRRRSRITISAGTCSPSCAAGRAPCSSWTTLALATRTSNDSPGSNRPWSSWTSR